MCQFEHEWQGVKCADYWSWKVRLLRVHLTYESASPSPVTCLTIFLDLYDHNPRIDTLDWEYKRANKFRVIGFSRQCTATNSCASLRVVYGVGKVGGT